MTTLPTDYTDAATPTGATTEFPATTSRGLNAINTQINTNTTAITNASSAAIASVIAARDANANLFANNVIESSTSTATAAGTTTLTVASTAVQVFTGTTTQTVKLPTTSVTAGGLYVIINQSTGAVTVQSSGANTVAAQASNSVGLYVADKATPTAAADWVADVTVFGKALTVNNSLVLAGTDGTTITFPSTSATVARTDAANTFTGHQTIEGVTSTGATGTGQFVFDTSPTLATPTVSGYTETVQALGTVGSTKTIGALSNGTVVTATLTASTTTTFTMPTATAGNSFVLLLKQPSSTGNGNASFTSVKWPTAGAPTITATAGKMDILTFIADGTNWYGSYNQGYTY